MAPTAQGPPRQSGIDRRLPPSGSSHHDSRRRVARQHPWRPARGVRVIVRGQLGNPRARWWYWRQRWHRRRGLVLALRRPGAVRRLADGRARSRSGWWSWIHARCPARVADPVAAAGDERGDRHHAGGRAGDQQHQLRHHGRARAAPLPLPRPRSPDAGGVQRSAAGILDRESVTPADFADWRRETRTLTHLSAADWWDANLSGIEQPEPVPGFRVTADFFNALARTARPRPQLSSPTKKSRDVTAS